MTPYERAYDVMNRVSQPGWGDEITLAVADAIKQAVLEERAMTNVLKAIEFAQRYLWETQTIHYRKTWPMASDVKLNRQLQYLLCGYVQRTVQVFQECSRKEVATFIEHWIAAQGTSAGHAEPVQGFEKRSMDS